MKGIQGLIIAIGLGIAAALFNFAYLYSKSQESEMEAFIAIAPKVTVARGDVLKREHLVPVDIPRRYAANLKDYAFLYSGRETVIDCRVSRTLTPGSLLLKADLNPVPVELKFGQNSRPGLEERAMGVPVELRRDVPSLVEPGDLVTFIVPSLGWDTPTPAQGDSTGDDEGAAAPSARTENGKIESGKTENAKTAPAKSPSLKPVPIWSSRRPATGESELIGPFRVLSMGNRLGSAEDMRANRIPQAQETVMQILVHVEKDKNNRWTLEPEAKKLQRVLDETNSRPLAYLLHPRTRRPE
jgi:hypothetical protein